MSEKPLTAAIFAYLMKLRSLKEVQTCRNRLCILFFFICFLVNEMMRGDVGWKKRRVKDDYGGICLQG